MIGRVSGLPFMIGVWEVRTGTLAALLPLLLRRSSCLRVIEWADCGVSDYNCPSLGASAPRDLDVNRRSNLTPYRRPILTPLSGGF
jgi:CelD/BcsL family acetyltransferase involved in cellulose biosynthesis